jgi:Zn-dependent protease with chaperone function
MRSGSEDSSHKRVRFAGQAAPAPATVIPRNLGQPGGSPGGSIIELPVLSPAQKLDLETLRHPSENTFLAVIIAFNCLVFLGLGVACFYNWQILPIIAGFALFFYLLSKLQWVILYWFLYGNSVKVSASQYPEVHRAVRLASDYINLRPYPEVFVLSGHGMLELFIIKRFTKKGMLLFTSELIDNLLDSGDSRQLMMLIGRQLGHIKAGHFKWWFFKDVVGAFTFWINFAWWRRCHYTADRVGFLVAGNLEASRRALLTITVGKKLAQATRIEALREQEDDLRSSFFAWLSQVSQSYPFLIRRVMELESFRDRVLERPYSPVAREEVAALPPEVSRFQIININGQAIFGDRGSISVSQPA